MFSLTPSHRMIQLLITVGNPSLIPGSIPLKQSGPKKCLNAPKGVEAIEPTDNCSLGELLEGLETATFVLVDAWYEERRNASGDRDYYRLCYIFVKKKYLKPNEEFERNREVITDDLEQLLNGALWHIQAHSNPYLENGQVVEGSRAICLNAGVRTPLYRPDGQRVTKRQKDVDGFPIGDPQPIQADWLLKVEDLTIRLVRP